MVFRSNSRKARRSSEQNDDSSSSYEWQDKHDRYIMTFPIHPLPSMQAPFEESMLDATGENGFVPYANPDKSVEIRQQQLCKDGDASELDWNFTYNCHWRHHPKGKYHPLLKTIAQIVFGVHLLHQQLEKSVADVAEILLKHVKELDGFLQRANEDIEGSLRDMLFRRKCLRVPMEHVHEFDRLLEDRTYRAQLLDGNVTIERTINRMSALLNDYLMDMRLFRDAIQDLDAYLSHIGSAWTESNADVANIYTAMCGNTSGWTQFLQTLAARAESLGVVLVQVSSYCHEIEKRCGAASRRSLIASRSSSRSTNSRDASRSFRNFEHNKPLPSVPNERPPFMTPPSTNGLSTPEDASSMRKASNASGLSTGANSIVEEAPWEEPVRTQEVKNSPILPSPGTSNSDVTVLPAERRRTIHSEIIEKSQPDDSSRHEAHAREDSHSSATEVVKPVDQAEKPEPKRITVRNSKGDHSPPLTGKDSAYSSASGGSFASPTAAHPRSASTQSSYPRAQFGLFPSSTPSTPKHPITPRHGAMSPALSLSQASESAVHRPIARSQSALDNHHTYSTPKLLKRSSFASLRKLFSKKKHGGVDTIAE